MHTNLSCAATPLYAHIKSTTCVVFDAATLNGGWCVEVKIECVLDCIAKRQQQYPATARADENGIVPLLLLHEAACIISNFTRTTIACQTGVLRSLLLVLVLMIEENLLFNHFSPHWIIFKLNLNKIK